VKKVKKTKDRLLKKIESENRESKKKEGNVQVIEVFCTILCSS